MADFRFKVLGLAALATLFAGVSFGQTTILSCAVATPVANPGPASLRAEGTTELTGDFQFSCNMSASAAVTAATITTFMSAPVTSKLLSTNTALTGPLTEATLFLGSTNALFTGAPPAATGANTWAGGTFASGIVTGNSITFSGLTLPAGGAPANTIYGRIANIRVNANAVALTSTLTSVTAQILASANASSAATGSSSNVVGYVFKSLAAPAFTTYANNPTNTGAQINSYTTCAGNALPSTGTLAGPSFQVTLAELVGGVKAFKTAVGDAGDSAAAGGGAGAVTTAGIGTLVSLNFGAVPTGVTLYVPLTVTDTTATHLLSMTLYSGGQVTTQPNLPTGAPAGYVPFTASNGTVTLTYAVLATNPAALEAVNIPVFVSFSKNTFTTPQGPITVLAGLGPQAPAASATTIPNFAPVTAPVLNATTISLCSSNLLFPFVTSALGFDTGIALSNTSSDPFGTAQAPGTCALNFYGSGLPSPSTGIAAPNGTQNGGTTNAFLLSSVAPGFTGYMIATCNYNFGHGFAYIVYNLTQNSGVSMGYLAEVLNPGATGRNISGSESNGQ